MKKLLLSALVAVSTFAFTAATPTTAQAQDYYGRRGNQRWDRDGRWDRRRDWNRWQYQRSWPTYYYRYRTPYRYYYGPTYYYSYPPVYYTYPRTGFYFNLRF